MNSFYHELRKKGYTREMATNYCIMIENKLPIPNEIEEMYWTWCNEIFPKKGE